MHAKSIIQAVALHTAHPQEDIAAIAKALIKTGAWSEIKQPIVYLVLALMAEATPDTATSMARHYYHLSEGNAIFGELLESIVNAFIEKKRNSIAILGYRSRYEVFTNCPAIRIHTSFDDGVFETTYGDDGHLPSGRRYTLMTGKMLFDIVAEMARMEIVAVA